eukprot:scaffold1756_cov117-Isochrysis_galbana.AAC.4
MRGQDAGVGGCAGRDRTPLWQHPPPVPAGARADGPRVTTERVRIEEKNEHREHGVGKDADVEHELVHVVEGDGARKRERAQRVREEQRHDGGVERESSPGDEPWPPPSGAQPERDPEACRSAGREPALERLRAQQPVLVHLGDGAIAVRHGQ